LYAFWDCVFSRDTVSAQTLKIQKLFHILDKIRIDTNHYIFLDLSRIDIAGVHKIAILLLIAVHPNFRHLIVGQISCSLVNEMRNINSQNVVMRMQNQKNSKIGRVIQPKCPGSIINANQNVLVMWSMNPF
jgi:hypothetical protein